MKFTDPVVHYVPDGHPATRDCRNAIVTGSSPSGDILSLAVFGLGEIQFRLCACHAPPPDPGASTWHQLAECVGPAPEPPRTLRERITRTLEAGPPLGLSARQVRELTGTGDQSYSREAVTEELRKMLSAGLVRVARNAKSASYVLAGPLAPEGPLHWHKGRHAWAAHGGYPRHQHSLNGCLTIAPGDTRVHFAHGPGFGPPDQEDKP